MTKFLTVPIHVNALTLDTVREAVGPQLDVSRAPWFGKGDDGVIMDHFSSTPNLAAAIRHDPMTSNNRYLQRGTHLHWSMPDALTRGTTHPEALVEGADDLADMHSNKHDLKDRIGPYVRRNGLYFPQLPNRWMITRLVGGKIRGAWFIESDFVHEWGEGAASVSYPITPRANWPHPYLRLGRSVDLMDAEKPAKGRRLADMGEHLTAVGSGDPEFAALYTACHSVFGHYIEEPSKAGARFDVLGWYDKSKDGPLEFWSKLESKKPERLAGILAMVGERAQAETLDITNAQQKAREIRLRDRSGWALSDESKELMHTCSGVVFHGSVTLSQSTPSTRPAAVHGNVVVASTPTGAVAGLLAHHAKDGALETELAAIEFGQELQDHRLDMDVKLEEMRHSAGFVAAGTGMVWQVRPHSEATSNAMVAAEQPKPARTDQMPADIAHRLDQLNASQVDMNRALDVLQSCRQDLFADWHSYMMAAYPEDDTADFDFDIDRMRDVLIPQSHAACIAANQPVTTAYMDVMARRDAINSELDQFNATVPSNRQLELVLSHSARFWRPKDPVVALDAAQALVPTPRHGQDHRGRDDGFLECQVIDLPALPDPSNQQTDIDGLRDILGLITSKASDLYKEIAETNQGTLCWHPLLVEWAADVHPSSKGTTLRGNAQKFDPTLLSTQFQLNEDQCDFVPTNAAQYAASTDVTQITGRSMLTNHGGDILLDKTNAYLERISLDVQHLEDEKVEINKEITALDARVDALSVGVKAKRTTLVGRITEFDSQIVHLGTLSAHFKGISDDLAARHDLTTASNITTFSLGGFMERLLMRRSEPLLPISDPLGFGDDRLRAEQVRHVLQDAKVLRTPEQDAPFLPLATARIELNGGRVIDTFGQFISWAPKGGEAIAAKSMRAPGDKSIAAGAALQAPVVMSPRIVQPSRLDFRLLSNSFDAIETNDHPATSPVCGWLVPNDFDRNILIYDTLGQALGSVDDRGIWHPAPGDPNAPAGPALIGNDHLARVVTWLVSRSDPDFIRHVLDTMDSSLRRINPSDYATHGARALLIGRPMAVIRARVSMAIQGLPAKDTSRTAMQLRLNGTEPGDHGFGDIQFPIRIGEHGQLNDGLVGYFVDGDADRVLYAPQSSMAGKSPHIKVFDEDNATPINLTNSFNDEPLFLTLLADPRCPVHATTGVLPTKAIRIPREHYEAALNNLQVTFSALPVLMPPGGVSLPLPTEPHHRWSWLQIEKGAWRETPAEPSVERDDLLKALPGACALHENGDVTPLDAAGHVTPLGQGDTVSGASRRVAIAELLWRDLIANGWIEQGPYGRGMLAPPAKRKLSPIFDTDVVNNILTKITRRIEQAERHAVLTPRAIAREGWLKLTPTPQPDPGTVPHVAPAPPETPELS